MCNKNKKKSVDATEKDIKRRQGDRFFDVSGILLCIAGFIVVIISPPANIEIPILYVRKTQFIIIILYILWTIKWLKHFKKFYLND